MAGVDPFDEVKVEVEAAVVELARNRGWPTRCHAKCATWRDSARAMRCRSVHSHGVDAARCRTDVRPPRALVLPCSKVKETVEQIEFDLGMLDESIER
jgi:hypothetical protein